MRYFVRKGRYCGDASGKEPFYSSVLTDDELKLKEEEYNFFEDEPVKLKENFIEMAPASDLDKALEKIKILEGALEEIGADMYIGYKKSCTCVEAANKAIERANDL